MIRFPHGASYYPLMERSPDNWEIDLKSMKQAGINYVRTAEIFNGWDQLEIEPDVFRFDELKEFFDAAHKHGIQILLGSGSTCPPYWLHQMDETVNIVNSRGDRYPVNASYGWACYNNPTFRERHSKYLGAMVNYFKNHSALLGYQINNELGYPFMPLGTGDIDVYCYCENCKLEFRKWVKEKYKTLEELNFAWRWSATNTFHTSWEQVEPPYTKPTAWASITRWMDWRLFHMDVMTRQVKREVELINTLDKKHFTTLNIFYLHENDPFSAITAIDQFELAKAVDIIGYDVYPGSLNKIDKKEESTSMVLDHARSISKPLNKKYWLAETEAGPIGGWVLGPQTTSNYDDIVRYQMDGIGHDAKSVMYQLYKEYEFQPIHWGGIVNLDGSETERTEAVRMVSDFVEEFSDFIDNSTTRKGQVAILVSKENQIVLNGVNQEDFLMEELRGVYSTLYELGYDIDFINPEHMDNGYADDYDVVFAPLLAVVQQELAKNIQRYVQKGGLFIAGARFSFMEDHGWYSQSMPSFGLKDVFGIELTNVYQNDNIRITYKDEKYHGYHHIEKINTLTAKVIGTFKDGGAAVTQNSYGSGSAVYIGTHLGNAYYKHDISLLKQIFIDILPDMPRITAEYEGKGMREIDIHSLSDEHKEMLIITNYAAKDYKSEFFNQPTKSVTITHFDTGIESIKEYGTNCVIDFDSDDRVTFKVDVEMDKVKVLIIEKKR